jgi:hypothetical protein
MGGLPSRGRYHAGRALASGLTKQSKRIRISAHSPEMTMSAPRPTLACAALLCLLGPSAHASGPGEAGAGPAGTLWLPGGALTYAVFEETVAHADLASCPADFDPDAVFCRLTIAAEAANVFVFLFEGDQALVAVKRYPLDEGVLPF